MGFREELCTEDHLLLTLGLELSTLPAVAQRLQRPLDRIGSAWESQWDRWRFRVTPRPDTSAQAVD